MTLYANRYRVESNRLAGWDYRNPGYYFVTLCSYNRRSIFGKMVAGGVILNQFGKIVEEEWVLTARKRSYIFLDTFVVMSDHFHAILRIGTNAGWPRICRDVARNVSTPVCQRLTPPTAGSLSVIIRAFKSAVTRRFHEAGYHGRVWQSGYFDRIIRNDGELMVLRSYTRDNPTRGEMVASANVS